MFTFCNFPQYSEGLCTRSGGLRLKWPQTSRWHCRITKSTHMCLNNMLSFSKGFKMFSWLYVVAAVWFHTCLCPSIQRCQRQWTCPSRCTGTVGKSPFLINATKTSWPLLTRAWRRRRRDPGASWATRRSWPVGSYTRRQKTHITTSLQHASNE